MGEFTVGKTAWYGAESATGANKIKYSSFTMPKKGIPKRAYIKVYDANGKKFKVAIYDASKKLLAESDEGDLTGGGIITSQPAYFTGAPVVDLGTIKLAQNQTGGRFGFGRYGSLWWYNRNYNLAWPATLSSGSWIGATLLVWVVFDEVWDDSANLKAGFMIKQVDSEDLPGEFVVRQGIEDLPGKFIVRHETSVDLPAGFDGQVSLNLPGELIVRHSTSLDLAGSFDSQVSLNLPGEFVIQREASANLAAEFLVLQWQEDLLGAFIVRHETSADLPGEFIVRQPGSVNLLGEFVIRHSTTENLYAEIVVRHSTTLDLPAEFVVKQWREDLPAEFDVQQEQNEDLPAEFNVRQETSADLPGEFVIRHSTTENLYAEFEVGQGSLNLPAGFTVRHETSIDLPGEFIVRHSASRDLPAAFDGQVSLNLPAEFKVGQDSVNLLAGFHVQHFESGSADLSAEFEAHIPWLDGWTYRKEVTLVEQAGGNYNDYPTIITVTWNAHMKNDFADCRFTEADKETPIPYGIVQKTDGVSCDFVIKRDYTSGCTLTVYLYYGNPGAADASVDHGPWALAWYLANGFGQNPSSYTNTTCSQYPRSASEAIPAWADIVFGGCTANGGYRAYYGRAKINGVAKAWASTVVCSGRANALQLKWKKYNCSHSMYDDAAFNPGASNTVTWGHFSGGNTGFWVSYYPEDPSVSFGAEEAKLYPASANLLGEFVVRQETSVDLPAGFDGQTSVDLLGEFVVRHGVSRDLYVEFVVGQWQENLFGEFGVRQETSIGLPGEFNIRQAGSVDLPAEFNVGSLFSSEDLLGEFIIRQPSSADLLCGFSIRHEASVNLSAEFTVRHIGIPLNLAAELIVRQEVSVNLPGEFIVRHVGTPVELLGKTEVQQSNSAELLGKAIIRQPGFAELLGRGIIRHVGTPIELLGKVQVRHVGTPVELLGKTEVQQSNSAEFLGKAEVKNISSAEFIGEFVVRHEVSADLLVEFISKNVGSADLPAEFIIRHEASVDLYAAFQSQTSVDLLSKFTVRHLATINLPGEFIVKHSATINLPGKFIARHSATLDLLGEFIVRQVTSEDLLGELVVKHSSSQDLLGELIIRHSATLSFLGEFVARHESSVDLLGEFIVRQVTSEDLLGELVVRHEASVDLYAAFESQASVGLLSEFAVRQLATINLLCKFIVRARARTNLSAKFKVIHSENLLAKLWIRHPYRLWTNRRYLNGVVELDEVELSNALLEYVIQGVMDDIKSQLINEDMLVYDSWTDITKTPKLIRRATTYGTVASLYSRDINDPNRRIVMGLRPIRIRAAEARSAQERAMDYWETRMEKMMSLYLTSGGRRLMIVDTEDEEAVFSLEDIPFYSEDPYKIKVR